MTVLIIDAPEVMQRSLVEALEAAGMGHRLVPDARTDAVADAPAPESADAAIWFADEHVAGQERSFQVLARLTTTNITRLIVVEPLRPAAQRHPGDSLPDAQAAHFTRGIVQLSTGPIYGPGDELVSRLLVMMRSLPAVPLLAHGERRYQPVWHEDLSAILVRLLRNDERAHYRIVGPDVTTQTALYDAIAPLIDREPLRLPLPDFLTKAGVIAIDAASGTDRSFAESVWAVDGHDEPLPPGDNDLARLLDAPPTSLHVGLRRLTNALPEQLPSSGVGGLDVKHFWGDITGTSLTAPGVLGLFRDRFADVMPVPVGVEPAAPRTRLDEGATLTLQLPGRGHVQVRVEAADESHVVLSTLRGHPLAGVVRFRTAALPTGVRFEVMTADKAATPIDWLALTLGGARVQDANWRTLVSRVADVAGGTVSAVHARRRRASEAEAEHLSTWVSRLTDVRS